MDGLQFFDPKQEFTVAWKSLPHWAQAGTVCFITWRTADSLPADVVKQLAQERRRILQRFGLSTCNEWQRQLKKLSISDRGELQWSLFHAWDQKLDSAAGECVLRRPELSAIVANSLLHFDGERYFLTDFVVMPNHVHVLVAFQAEDALLTQCTSWKRYTSRKSNPLLAGTESSGKSSNLIIWFVAKRTSSTIGDTSPRIQAKQVYPPARTDVIRRRSRSRVSPKLGFGSFGETAATWPPLTPSHALVTLNVYGPVPPSP
jgi:hypothetical protein